ncbi:hypothetical protein HOY82DRAFT_175427 [Tuber indicum]|nr:hypothetical protein HOY82DRAFT_175427 [Tuber indicum]
MTRLRRSQPRMVQVLNRLNGGLRLVFFIFYDTLLLVLRPIDLQTGANSSFIPRAGTYRSEWLGSDPSFFLSFPHSFYCSLLKFGFFHASKLNMIQTVEQSRAKCRMESRQASKQAGSHLPVNDQTGCASCARCRSLRCTQSFPRTKHRVFAWHVYFILPPPRRATQSSPLPRCFFAPEFLFISSIPSVLIVLPRRCASALRLRPVQFCIEAPARKINYIESSSRIVPISHETKKSHFTSPAHNHTHHI